MRKWFGLIGITLLAFTVYLDATIVDTAIPFIRTTFQAPILLLQWLTTIFTLILSMTMIAIGKLSDVCGKKNIFSLGIAIFALGTACAGFSPSIETLIFFRALQALGASTVFVTSAALLSDVCEARDRIKAVSFFGGMTGFGLMVGPFLGGVIIQLLDWRWVFWINLPLIALGALLCFCSLKHISQEKHPVTIDFWSLLLLVVGLGTFMYGLISLSASNWTSSLAWVLFLFGSLALVVLLVLDTIRKQPLLDFHIFKEHLIVLAALSCALAGVASTVFLFFDPLYLRIVLDLPPLLIGLLIAVIPAAQACISFFLSKAVNYWGVAKLLFFSILAAFASILLHRFLQESTPIPFLILPFFLLGINWGISNSVMIMAVHQVIHKKEMGSAIGTITTIWNVVGSILLALSAVIFHSIEKNGTLFLKAFHGAVDLNIAFTLLVVIVATYVFTKRNKTHRS
jgi:MFS family permease